MFVKNIYIQRFHFNSVNFSHILSQTVPPPHPPPPPPPPAKNQQQQKTPRFVALCVNIPHVVWLVQKIFPDDFNPHCDLDLDSNPKLPQNTLAHDDAPLYRVWLQKFMSWKNDIFVEVFSPHCDLDLEGRIRNPTFSCATLGHDDAPSSYWVAYGLVV